MSCMCQQSVHATICCMHVYTNEHTHTRETHIRCMHTLHAHTFYEIVLLSFSLFFFLSLDLAVCFLFGFLLLCLSLSLFLSLFLSLSFSLLSFVLSPASLSLSCSLFIFLFSFSQSFYPPLFHFLFQRHLSTFVPFSVHQDSFPFSQAFTILCPQIVSSYSAIMY